jgi:hypothetical protein
MIGPTAAFCSIMVGGDWNGSSSAVAKCLLRIWATVCARSSGILTRAAMRDQLRAGQPLQNLHKLAGGRRSLIDSRSLASSTARTPQIAPCR